MQPGTRIGHYDVVAKLGEGGMGEVYRARDTRLGRDVAIKILPESFAADADRLMRFEREARTLASLNHPNIAAIYGLEDRALVMELVDGLTLEELIHRAALRLADAIPIAHQITEALEAAHEAGVVHRDLKPANIKIRPDGTLKILDFGLAKALTPEAATATTNATMTSPAPFDFGSGRPEHGRGAMTQMGLILGTAAYMAPEQAKGRPVDRRADIWAFGVVFYEMLTGRRMFDAEDMSETLAAVLTRDVSAASMPAELPPAVKALIADCLVRDPRKRLRDIGDARLRLEHLDTSGTAAQTRPHVPGHTRWLWPAVAAAAAAAAIVSIALLVLRPESAPPDAVTFEVTAPGLGSVAGISPDGRQVVFVSREPRQQLWVRSVSSLDARPIPGTEEAVLNPTRVPLNVTWSSDGRAIVFGVRFGRLRRVELGTGQVIELANTPGAQFAPGGWNRDGTILYGRHTVLDAGGNGIWRIAETGGTPVAVTEIVASANGHFPSGFLPDGRRFLYFVLEGTNSFDTGGTVRIGSIDRAPAEQDSTAILTADGPAVYAPAVTSGTVAKSGYLLFVRRGTLLAQAFDPARGALTSDTPIQIATGSGPMVLASERGDLLYRPVAADDAQQSELTRFSRTGAVLGTVGPAAEYGEVNLVDAGRLVISRTDGNQLGHIHVVDIARGVFTRLSPGDPGDYSAAPSPDGAIAYSYSPTGVPRDLYVRAANGVGDARVLVSSPTVKHANDWSPDGRFLIYDDHVPGRAQDLLLVARDGGTPIPFLQTTADETFGQFSPDGKWIAYKSTESARQEVYVRDFAPDRTPAHGTEKVQISIAGGDKPRWSPDGRELFFLQGATLMAVSVRPGKPFVVSRPVALFDLRPISFFPYDVMPDGSFIVNQAVAPLRDTPAPPLRVLLNWQSAIGRK